MRLYRKMVGLNSCPRIDALNDVPSTTVRTLTLLKETLALEQLNPDALK